MQQKFIHLQIHTEFSLRDGLIRIPALMQRLSKLNMGAAAITDHNNLYGAIKFYSAAIKTGIKPIIGCDILIKHEDPKIQTSNLTLLCQNQTGYLNLLQLISKAYLQGQAQGKPTLSSNWFTGATEGLIALSGGIKGNIGQALIEHHEDKACAYLNDWRTLFPDRFYLAISRIDQAEEALYLEKVVYLAHTQSIPLVATNQVCFLNADDFDAHEARVCIHEGSILNDPKRTRLYQEKQYLRSTDDMIACFKDIPEALSNTVEIAKRCNLTLTLGKNKLPHFSVPETYTTEDFLCQSAKTGLEQRLKLLFHTTEQIAEKRRPYDERLARELDVINNMGFAGYFLIVADFTRWSKENDIPVGPGRGSGPGSLVAYALSITDLDPIALELLFERFLNPERVSMPDFDIDFCIEGRDKVIDYVIKTHGHESVSQIITYGTMAAKAVVRDVGRVLGMGYGYVDKLAKLIPFELGITLNSAIQQEPLLKERYENEEDVKTLFDLALKLEGLTRNVGKHAGGIVIAPGRLTDFVPLYCEANDTNHPVTQFDKDDVEAVGLVKFDFLGLKTLTIIKKTVQNIKNNVINPETIDITSIALDDTATFNLLKACKSTAVFQLESHGMRDLIKRLQPDCFEDLIALVALFRPGPLQSGMVDDFIDRKHGRAKVIYPHPTLEPILSPTYGVILYQEQVMQIAQVLAGYTLGAADILRRAMGKKKPEEMAKQRQIFCDGAQKNNIDPSLANQIFDIMEKFAGYGFNKSHSASYALIAYQTAWLKTHYPAAFMAAVLSADMDKTEKIMNLLDECRMMKLHVSPPDINQSEYEFHVASETHIYYGLGAIKGVGTNAIENIIETRRLGGSFLHLFDFCKRIDLKKMNRRTLEAFIKSGCFDSLGVDRAILMHNLNDALKLSEQQNKDARAGQQDLMAVHTEPSQITAKYQPCSPWGNKIRLQGEKETLGFYLTGHPLDEFSEELSQLITCQLVELNPSMHKSARIAGIIASVRTRQTKRGNKMAILTIDDGSMQRDIVCFSDLYHRIHHLLIPEQMIIIDGDVTIDEFNNEARVLAKEIMTLEEARKRLAKKIQIDLNDENLNADKLKTLLNGHLGGQCQLIINHHIDNIFAQIHLHEKWLVTANKELLTLLQTKLEPIKIQLIY